MYQPNRVGGAGRYRVDATRIFTSPANCNAVDSAINGVISLNSFAPSKDFGMEDQLVLQNKANLQLAGNNATAMGVVLKSPPDTQKYMLEVDMTAGMVTAETELMTFPLIVLLNEAQKINTAALVAGKSNTGQKPQLLPVTSEAKHGHNQVMACHHALIYSDEGATRGDAHGIFVGWWILNSTGQAKSWLARELMLQVGAKFDTYHESVFEPQ